MNPKPGWLLHSVVLISLVIRTKTSSVNHFPCPNKQEFESCKIEEIIIHPCNQGLFDHYCNLYPKQPTVIVVIWTSPMRCKKAAWNLYANLPNGYQSIINDTNACNYTKCPFDGKRRMLIYDFQIPDLLKSQVYEFMFVLKSGKGNHACCTCFGANVNKDIELRSRSDESKLHYYFRTIQSAEWKLMTFGMILQYYRQVLLRYRVTEMETRRDDELCVSKFSL